MGGKSPWPLYLWGDVGTGKSCAGLTLLDYAGGWYVTAQGLSQMMIDANAGRLTYPNSGRPIHPANLWSELAATSLVVVDEIACRVQVSEHQYDCLKKLLDLRENRPLVGISNGDLEAVTQLYDERIASRLAAGTVMRLVGDDQRLQR